MAAGEVPGAGGSADGTDAARAALAGQMRDSVLAGRAVEAAFRAVPRHLFVPEMAPEQAYQDEAFVIKCDAAGRPVSSSSQPAMMAIMLEQLGLEAGQRVLEIGTGTGYNAALMAHIVGDQRAVVTVDIDPELVSRARASLAAAGYGEVRVSCGDGGLGVAEHAPYDRIILTVGAWDIAPQWLAQLAPGGRLVLPLSVRGIQLSVALERAGDHWASRSACRCGFIRMAGPFAGPESFLPLGPQPGLQVQADDGRPLDARAVYQALTGTVTDVPAQLRSASMAEVGDLDLWLTLTEPSLTRLTLMETRSGRVSRTPLMPMGGLAGTAGPAGEPGVAVILPVRQIPESEPEPAADVASQRPPGRPGPDSSREPPAGPASMPIEIVVRGYGPGGGSLAGYLAQRALAWQDLGRPGVNDLQLRAYPPGTPDEQARGKLVVDRRHVRLALDWPPAATLSRHGG
jgi:protein-L-isoaspartate(D-aspartate) O-methyltransferase